MGDHAIFLNDIWLWGSGLLYIAHFLLFMKQSMPLARASGVDYLCWCVLDNYLLPPTFLPLIHDCAIDMPV